MKQNYFGKDFNFHDSEKKFRIDCKLKMGSEKK